MNNFSEPHQDMSSHGETVSRHGETRQDNVETNLDRHQDNRLGAQQSRETTKTYSLTIEDAWNLFANAGFDYSQRTITRWCHKGQLDATLHPEENGQYEKWYVNKQSVERKIESLKQVRPHATPPGHAQRHGETVSRHDETRQDNVETNLENNRDGDNTSSSRKEDGQNGNDQLEEENRELKKKIGDLETQLRTAEIDKAGSTQFREHLMQQNKQLMSEMKDTHYRLGKAEAQLLALRAPIRTEGDFEIDDGVNDETDYRQRVFRVESHDAPSTDSDQSSNNTD